jgi:hypothetical protein
MKSSQLILGFGSGARAATPTSRAYLRVANLVLSFRHVSSYIATNVVCSLDALMVAMATAERVTSRDNAVSREWSGAR